MTTLSDDFPDQVEVFLKRHGMAASTFGLLVCNDPNFVADLRRGRKPNLDLYDKVKRFMDDRERALAREPD